MATMNIDAGILTSKIYLLKYSGKIFKLIIEDNFCICMDPDIEE